MPAERRFAGFARRLTRSYVLLALLLIVAVGGATTTVAFVEFASSLDALVASSAQRASDFAAAAGARHESIAQFAPQLVKETSRPRIRVVVRDAGGTVLAGSTVSPSRAAEAIAALLGIHAAVTHVDGGVVVVAPDIGGFARFLAYYWAIILPVGLLAMLVAWAVGRRITSRAISPLGDVTQALRNIAAGDFTPKPLLSRDTELRELTSAYDEVAYRLSAATAERLRNETEMRQFIADAGHELRTPLTVVMGYIEALRGGVVTDPDGVERVYDTMLSESRRMRTVIEKLIFLARLERQAPPRNERVDLDDVAKRAIAAVGPSAAGRIEYAGSAAEIAGDADELAEAVKNVIENALKYAPESPVTVDVSADGGRARLMVRDLGPGMDAQDVERAFDRFYRGDARASAEGSGLGLAIAKRALERAGGTIALGSELGRGTTVTMTFPIAR